MPEFPEVVAIFGPTASGKSDVAELVADRLGTEVVSADALQVYRGLPILTNQPARPTRLVAVRELSHEMSVGEYARLAHAAIDELVDANGAAVVAGGTGLYLRAALVDLGLPPPPAADARRRWEAAYDADPAAAHAHADAAAPAEQPLARERLRAHQRLHDAGLRRQVHARVARLR
jgi:tRNA dimethylallyltransferase